MNKKTLAALALTAALGASPAWAAEVVSANTVGYQKVTLVPGFNFVAPQFLTVGGGSIDIQSVHLDVADADATGGDNIQILDADGNPVAQYYWFPAEWIDGVKSGWVDETGDRAAVDIANGLAVLIEAVDDSTVTISGEVCTNDAATVSVAGFNFVGNASPVEVDIQDFQIDIADADATGGDNIQILDDTFNPVAQYYWFPAEWIDGVKSGWVDETGDRAQVSIAPGQGFLFESVDDGTVISAPAAQ